MASAVPLFCSPAGERCACDKEKQAMPDELLQALREFITHEIDIIHESDWWKELIDEAVDRRLAEREADE
jgi:hypothetical protein